MSNDKFMKLLKKLQADELTEKLIYMRIAKRINNIEDKNTLTLIANEEQKHYDVWKKYTECDVKPNLILVFWYTLLSKILGYTFSIKIMELKQNTYIDKATKTLLEKNIPEAVIVFLEEDVHERKLIEMIDEDRLQYVGSMVLGLNDALVEFTGCLAGWSFAMQSNKLISLAGLITGISATLSMASSEYLSAKNEGDKNALRSASYTGIAYLITVVILILPYLLLPDNMYMISLFIMLIGVIVIIAAFNYYISVANGLSFKDKFKEMSIISLSVASISFIIGLLVKRFLGIDI